jgi:hypothetical protein
MEQNKPRGTREKNFMWLAKGYDVGITETIIILHEELPKKKEAKCNLDRASQKRGVMVR